MIRDDIEIKIEDFNDKMSLLKFVQYTKYKEWE